MKRTPTVVRSLLITLWLVLLAGCASAPPEIVRLPREPVPENFEFIADFDVAPRLRSAPRTAFPPFMVAQGVRGRATVDFLISAQGKVSRSKVDNATHEALGASALSTVSRMEFYPATKNGTPVAVAARVSFTFDYDEP